MSTMSTEKIRVSCSGLASIKINGKYLLVQNKKGREDGRIVYGPLGGALEYFPEALEFLNTLSPIFERETPDLRMTINEKDVNTFDKWVRETNDREQTCKRELYEELIIEEKILYELNLSNVQEEYLGIFRDKRSKWNEPLTERFFEIYKITFTSEIENKLIEISNDPNSTIRLVSKEEILENCDEDLNIGFHSRFIIT